LAGNQSTGGQLEHLGKSGEGARKQKQMYDRNRRMIAWGACLGGNPEHLGKPGEGVRKKKQMYARIRWIIALQ
jgi:hypothetical protein